MVNKIKNIEKSNYLKKYEMGIYDKKRWQKKISIFRFHKIKLVKY